MKGKKYKMEIKFLVGLILCISLIALLIVFELMTSEKRDYINIAFNKRKKWFIFKTSCRLIFVFLIILSLFFSLKNKQINFKNERFLNKYDVENIFKIRKNEGIKEQDDVEKPKGLLDGIEKNETSEEEQETEVKSLLDGIE